MNKLTNGQTKMHNITPNTPHFIVPLTVAMHSSVTDIESAADGLNELLRSAVDNDLLADYKFTTSPSTPTLISSSAPTEGELFDPEDTKAINSKMYTYNENDGDTKLIWVVATESLSESTVHWYNTEMESRCAMETNKELIGFKASQCHLFAFEVNAKLTKKEIKREVEDFYNEVSRSLEFNASELVEGYPYCPEAWLHIVANHYVTN
ncbi:hypothetical protein M3899_003137 [Vibrio parahaemolyticus]|nr:hypothetical protein [Vibrio parahaemolyticus]